MKILILEDDSRRCEAMRDCLSDRFVKFEVLFSPTASQMRQLIEQHFGETILIALDHDLELIETEDGSLLESGTGREIADLLASRSPVCPVVIHSTNSPAAVGMQMVLDEAGWETHRVLPFGDLEWIPKVWFRAVRDAIVGSLHRGLDDVEAGRTHDMDDVFRELDETYGRADPSIFDQ